MNTTTWMLVLIISHVFAYAANHPIAYECVRKQVVSIVDAPIKLPSNAVKPDAEYAEVLGVICRAKDDRLSGKLLRDCQLYRKYRMIMPEDAADKALLNRAELPTAEDVEFLDVWCLLKDEYVGEDMLSTCKLYKKYGVVPAAFHRESRALADSRLPNLPIDAREPTNDEKEQLEEMCLTNNLMPHDKRNCNMYKKYGMVTKDF